MELCMTVTQARMAACGTVLTLLSKEDPGNIEVTQWELLCVAKPGSLGTQPILIHSGPCKNPYSLPGK